MRILSQLHYVHVLTSPEQFKGAFCDSLAFYLSKMPCICSSNYDVGCTCEYWRRPSRIGMTDLIFLNATLSKQPCYDKLPQKLQRRCAV